MKVFIIVPTYNERENIRSLIEAPEGQFKRIPHDMHILVLDDTSPYGNAEVVRGV
jgi:dolichol-phosphate mannosyltransferase